MASPNMSKARVKREVVEVKKDAAIKNAGITLDYADDGNEGHLFGEIPGPPDTPFAGGRFRLDILIPPTYPFSPPKVKFLTKIWHPNVSSQTGMICLDILKDQWAAAMTLRTVMLSIQALLTAAEPDDPQDAVVAKQYKEARELYDKTAAHWAHAYGGAPASGNLHEMVQQLSQMGFGEEECRNALSTRNWNMERAAEMLLS